MTTYCLVGPFIYKKHMQTHCISTLALEEEVFEMFDIIKCSMHCWIKTKWLGDCNHVITLYSSKCYSITQWFVDNNQLITLHSPKCWKKTKWLGNRSHLIRRLCKDIPPCLCPCFWKHFIFLSACISKCLFSYMRCLILLWKWYQLL